jgi:predicted porin
VAYVSPSFSGFAFAAAYSTDPLSTAQVTTRNPLTGAIVAITNVQNAGDAADMGVYNLNATYTNGPIYVGLAYGDGDGHEALGLGAHIRAAGGFTFGNAKVVAQYDSLESDVPTVGSGDKDAYMVGGSYTMGAIVLKANYMTAEFDNISVEPEQFAIGADYNLSKRTSVYALYVDATEGVVLGSGAGSSDILGPGIGADGDIAAFSLGVTHSF